MSDGDVLSDEAREKIRDHMDEWAEEKSKELMSPVAYDERVRDVLKGHHPMFDVIPRSRIYLTVDDEPVELFSPESEPEEVELVVEERSFWKDLFRITKMMLKVIWNGR